MNDISGNHTYIMWLMNCHSFHALGALMQITSRGQGASDETVRDNWFEFTSLGGLDVCLIVVKSSTSSATQKTLAMKCICR